MYNIYFEVAGAGFVIVILLYLYILYPNPTENLLQLELNGFGIPADGLHAILHDGSSKHLQTLPVTADRTAIRIGQYATGTYYLELRHGKQLMKTFKVVRK